MNFLMIGIYALIGVVAVVVGLFAYLLVKSSFRTGQIEELEKEIQRIRTSIASPSALLIADPVNEENRLLFDVSMNNEKISGLAFKRGFWSGRNREGRGLASLRIWRKPKKNFRSVEYEFRGTESPNGYLWGNSRVKMLWAEVEERDDGVAVKPILKQDDLARIRSGEEFLRTVARAVEQMGKQNYEYFQQVITKWKQADLSFKKGLGEIATFVGRMARQNKKILGKIASGWNEEEGARTDYAGKMDAKKLGETLTKLGEEKGEVEISDLKRALDEAIEGKE